MLFILWEPRIKVAWNPTIEPTLVCTGQPGIVRGSSECRWPWMRNDNSFLSRPKSSGTTGVRFSPHRDLVGFLWALIYLIPVGCLGGYALMSCGLWNSQIWVFLSSGYKISRFFITQILHIFAENVCILFTNIESGTWVNFHPQNSIGAIWNWYLDWLNLLMKYIWFCNSDLEIP